MSIALLKSLGLTIEVAPIGEGLTLVQHKEPFRYFNNLHLTPPEGYRAASKATLMANAAGETHWSLLTTQVWKMGQEHKPEGDMEFPFSFIMESELLAMDVLTGVAREAEKIAADAAAHAKYCRSQAELYIHARTL
jgi:hypothetical protein